MVGLGELNRKPPVDRRTLLSAIADFAVSPTGNQADSRVHLENRFAGTTPDAWIGGDSRANQWTASWLRADGYSTAEDLGISGQTAEEWAYQIENTAIDRSQVLVEVDEIGQNSLRFEPNATPQYLAQGVFATIKFELAHLAAGAHLYFVECYYDVPGTGGFSQSRWDSFNSRMEHKAENSGKFVFVTVNDILDTSTDYRDSVHLNDLGNAKVQDAIEAEMIAHGDYVPAGPEWHPSIGNDGFLLG